MNLNAILILFSVVALCLLSILSTSDFAYATKVTYDTSGIINFTVPNDVTSITVKAWGAGGGKYVPASSLYGGGGGFAQGTISVSSGQTYKIVVGGGGQNVASCGSGGAGGTNGGGNGGNNCAGGADSAGGGGGGYSGIFLTSVSHANAKVIAGGGAGSSGSFSGGGGGGTSGIDGTDGGYNTNGKGGTQSSGGAGGSGGNSGSTLQGGNGIVYSGGGYTWGGGGGGGGYYGGGGGGAICCGHSGSGGGGSGFVTGTNTQMISGSGSSVANSAGSDYVSGKGNGATGSSNGQDGLVVILYNQTSVTNQTSGKSFTLVATTDVSKQKNNLGTSYTDIHNGAFEPDFNLINFTGYTKVRILSGWDYSDGDSGNHQMRWVDASNNTRVLHETSTFTVDQDPNDSGWIVLPTWAKNETTVEWQGKSTVSADDPIAKYFRIFLR